ncbi:unnamed protein product [Porites lobata]|uniref:Uncharacterized protein n=1 Tax=Porites lobata TaxID=104759 RepID=A0ABN8N956_9CNID|nr:unnamed protein product [Porites lobata]
MAIRKSDDSGEKPKKAKLRRSTFHAIGFLAEKSEKNRIEKGRRNSMKLSDSSSSSRSKGAYESYRKSRESTDSVAASEGMGTWERSSSAPNIRTTLDTSMYVVRVFWPHLTNTEHGMKPLKAKERTNTSVSSDVMTTALYPASAA